jgi:DNA polymerase-3 subunit delta'
LESALERIEIRSRRREGYSFLDSASLDNAIVPFRTIAGHSRLLSLLARAIARDSMPPAVLMAGPAGVGKRLTAVAVAQAINCLQPVVAPGPLRMESAAPRDPAHAGEFERDACGECASCRRIARGTHPDVVTVEPGESGSIKIEQLRDVIDRSQFRPFEGRRRVVIIDEADAAAGPAQSALLKTLEEPPSASVFILVSSIPDALLPTVLSRCPRLRFGPLTPGDVARVLMRDHGYSEHDARAAAADADGSVGRALQSRSDDLIEAREDAQRILQASARDTDPVKRINVARDLMEGKRTLAEERIRLAVRLRSLGSLLRDVGIIASRADRAMLANADLEGRLETLSSSFDADRSQRAYAAVDRALAALDRNASPKVVADWLLLEL